MLRTSVAAISFEEDYGRMLLAGGRPDDVARARRLLDDAVATYVDLGMDSFAAAAFAL
jgi:hypothetical protein